MIYQTNGKSGLGFEKEGGGEGSRDMPPTGSDYSPAYTVDQKKE